MQLIMCQLFVATYAMLGTFNILGARLQQQILKKKKHMQQLQCNMTLNVLTWFIYEVSCMTNYSCRESAWLMDELENDFMTGVRMS